MNKLFIYCIYISKNKLGYTRSILDAKSKTLSTKWLRVVSSREYRSGITYFCKVIRENKPSYWLMDAIRMSSPTLKDQKWTVRKLCALFADTSLKKLAIVIPDDLFHEIVSETIRVRIQQKIGDDVAVEHFRSSLHAAYWLDSIKENEGLFSTGDAILPN